MEPVNAAIVYYSSTGTVHALAQPPPRAPRRLAHRYDCAKLPNRPRRRRSTPTRPGANTSRTPPTSPRPASTTWTGPTWCCSAPRPATATPASQLKAFIDTTGSLWQRGRLADKVYSALTASGTAHGGQESTLLALGNVFYHWGGIIVPPGYTDPIQLQTGNPYGTSHLAADGPPDDVTLEAARYQARRAVDAAAALKAGRAA